MAQGVKWEGPGAEELEKLLRENTEEKVGRMFGVKAGTIYAKVKKYGIKTHHQHVGKRRNRKNGTYVEPGTGTPHYTTDSQRNDYFNVLDSEKKAYFLGLLLADGGNNCEPGGNAYLSLSLSRSEDKVVVDALWKELNGNQKVYVSERIAKKVENKFQIYRRELTERLGELGVVKDTKEHHIARPHEIPLGLRKHLIRGLLDGDGTIYPPNHELVIHSASRRMLNTVSTWINAAFLTHKRIKVVRDNVTENGVQMYSLTPGGGKPLEVMEWLYAGACIYLPRKERAYMKWKLEQEEAALRKQENDPFRPYANEIEDLIQKKIDGTIKRGAQAMLATKIGVSPSRLSKYILRKI